MTTTQLTPAQMADRAGVTVDTLRYYEREGLLQNVARAESGHRRYSEGDVLWIEVLRCLRDTGMTIEQLRQYCDLGAQGDHTEPARRKILTDHRALVESQIKERHAALALIDHKLSFYDTDLSDNTANTANTSKSNDTSNPSETEQS